jgi:hypothetical protein
MNADVRAICPPWDFGTRLNIRSAKGQDASQGDTCLSRCTGLVTARWACGILGGRWPHADEQDQLQRGIVPPRIIPQAICLYLRFTLSVRGVKDLLAERAMAVSYATVRRWLSAAILQGSASLYVLAETASYP